MATRRASKSELNDVLKSMIPKNYEIPRIDTEFPIPEKLEAEKQNISTSKFSLETIYIEIQRMKRGKEFKIITY